MIVRDLKHQATHAILAVYQDGEWLLLDNRTLVMVSANEVRGYLPLYVLDQGGVRAVASAPTQPPWVPCAVRLPCELHGTTMKMARPERFELPTPKFVV